MKDHYETMLMPPGASADELKAQWRKLSRELHPDRFASMNAKVQLAATDRFGDLSRAWAVLEDPKARAAYDFERAVGKDLCGDCGGTGRITRRGLKGQTHKACSTCQTTGLIERAKKKGRKS